MKSDYSDTIWTDNERSRHMIWEAYDAFCEHFETYIMYKEKGIIHPVAKLGLIRYAHRIYLELKHLMTIFIAKDKMSEEQVEKFITMMNNPKHKFSEADFIFIRNLVADFMYFSGIKNIVISKDVRSNYEKIREKYGIKDESS